MGGVYQGFCSAFGYIYKGCSPSAIRNPNVNPFQFQAMDKIGRMVRNEQSGESLVFIRLNTADYVDKQIFAMAHELYLFFTNTSMHLSRQDRPDDDMVETKANWFAAEFLLPEGILKRWVFEESKAFSLVDIQIKVLLRFIARLHCTWWLPYRSLVKRLWEMQAITGTQQRPGRPRKNPLSGPVCCSEEAGQVQEKSCVRAECCTKKNVADHERTQFSFYLQYHVAVPRNYTLEI